jgi:hypothetical protein
MRLHAASLVLLAACTAHPRPEPAPLEHAVSRPRLVPFERQTVASRWLDVLQEVAGRDVDRIGARPTVLSHQMMIWAVAMHEAWATHDDRAGLIVLDETMRRPPAQRTQQQRECAIGHACLHALLGAFPHQQDLLRERALALGVDPNAPAQDPATPEGLGRLIAERVLAACARDGANMLGDEPGGDGTPYGDWTGYRPVNPPDRIVDPDRWQPIPFTRRDGSTFTPGFLTPHFGRVQPVVLTSPSQFRAEPPPTTRTDDARLRAETDAVLRMNASLTDRQKAEVEFMRDGPRSTGQSGHWLRFAQDVSRRDAHDLERDVKLYFAIAVIAFDAFVACWDTKRHYDSSRPWTLVRHYHAGQTVRGWAGPGGGVVDLPAEQWLPYSPAEFVTPPFPGYTSGHATVSGACSKMLERFTGSDRYGATEERRARALTERDPGPLVQLPLPTFSAAAEMAAQSRALGGYHIPVDNDVGLRIGREIADWAWPRFVALWDGDARAFGRFGDAAPRRD